MKTKRGTALIVLATLLMSLAPWTSALALGPIVVPPADMFQLPWEQGRSWVMYDGFDNGFKRLISSPHNYLNGGALDFAPHANMRIGEDTSNAWVTAAAAGTVVQVTGCSLMIDHGNGWIADYQFLAHIQVQLGEVVSRNQRLAVIADGLGEKFCPPALEPDVPHLHFSLRPNMRNATLSGWLISYIPMLNKTTLKRNGQTVGSFQPILNTLELQIVVRDAITWDTVYAGSVDGGRYERWPFTLSETTNFTVTAAPITSGLVPLVLLLDANGNELARGSGTLTSTQPAGSYFVQIQPQAGSGSYTLVLHKNSLPESSEPHVSLSLTPANIPAGAAAAVTVNLANVPAEGYASVEFTCTYDSIVAEAGSIAEAGLFGADAVTALNGPANGSFIFAIAGSNGKRAAGSGGAFAFTLTGLLTGQTTVECKARVSTGDNTLTEILPGSGTLTVGNVGPTPTSQVTPPPAPGASSTPTPSITATGPSPSDTASPTPTSSPTASPTATSTPTAEPALTGTFTGQVTASKPVTVSLFSGDSLVASAPADSEGAFSLSAPAGDYTAIAFASGFLKAQGAVSLVDGDTVSLPAVTLLAGDIDGNNVIDQLDAMTIGMNYNTAEPDAADLNDDGVINVLDLELLAHNYRASGVVAWQ